jgi:hypothetical protein
MEEPVLDKKMSSSTAMKQSRKKCIEESVKEKKIV